MITLYDIPSVLQPTKAWSFNTWKVRYALNIKKLPYKTVWVEYPDIEPLAKQIGAEPTEKRDGNPLYTLPIIQDASTGTTLQLILSGTYSLHLAFDDAVRLDIPRDVWRWTATRTRQVLTPQSEPFCRQTREQVFGQRFEELELVYNAEERKTLVSKVAKTLDRIKEWYINKDQPFLEDQVSYSDLQLAGILIWFKIVWGETSDEWKTIAAINEGKWSKLLNALKDYETIV